MLLEMNLKILLNSKRNQNMKIQTLQVLKRKMAYLNFLITARLKNSKKAFLAKMGRVVRLLVLMKTRITK